MKSRFNELRTRRSDIHGSVLELENILVIGFLIYIIA